MNITHLIHRLPFLYLLVHGVAAQGAGTTTTLTVSNANPVFSEAITLTAKVAGAAPTGTVRFCGEVGTALSMGFCSPGNLEMLGTATLDATGTASITITAPQPLFANYGAGYDGDANNAASDSNQVHVVINSAQTQTRIISPPATITLGDSYSVTVQVTALPPSTAAFPIVSGMESLQDNGSPDSGCHLSTSGGGIYTCSFKPSTVGMHSLTASYFLTQGAQVPAFLGSTSSDYPVVVKVDAPSSPTSIILTSTPNPSIVNEEVQFTATVRAQTTPASTGAAQPETAVVTTTTAAAVTGTLSFKEGGTVLANAAIGANGQAVVSLSGLSIGNHVVVATYSGDAANAPSTATLVQQVIAAGPGGNMPSAPALSTFALACIFLILVVAGVAALWHRRKAF